MYSIYLSYVYEIASYPCRIRLGGTNFAKMTSVTKKFAQKIFARFHPLIRNLRFLYLPIYTTGADEKEFASVLHAGV